MAEQAMRVGAVSPPMWRRLLAAGRVALQTGPLRTHIRCDMIDVAESLHLLYAHHPCWLDPSWMCAASST